MTPDEALRLARLLTLVSAARRTLAELAPLLDGEGRRRVELAATIIGWECDRAIEAGLRAGVRSGN